MSAAHTCFRSALVQAFRPSNRGVAASSSIPAFLVPALAPSSNRPSRSKRRHASPQHRPLHTSEDHSRGSEAKNLPPRPTREPLRSQIPIPEDGTYDNIEPWLAAIEPLLPVSARRKPSSNPDISSSVTPFDVALYLNKAQDASLDIIDHLGLVEGRWQAAVWIAKKLVEHGRRSIEPPLHVDAFGHVLGSYGDGGAPLKQLTEQSIGIERASTPRKLGLSLDDITSAPNTIDMRHAIVKRGLGQLWQSLGNLILAASERSGTDGNTIMPHVLEIIAYLHHVGFIPESVYSYRPRSNDYTLQQPPTLHMLSSKILTALSDAAWKAHESSVKSAKGGVKVSYFLGHEIPGSRYKIVVSEVAPELWLELVLWSCLRGGWILDGAALLRRVALRRGEQKWALISWREIMQAKEEKDSKTPAPSRIWNLFPRNADAAASPADRAQIRRTISGEVVSAFVDALVNHMRVGVGSRGTDPEVIIDLLKTLKDFLDTHNLSLGTTAWDSIMARLMESGGFDPEQRPELLMRIVGLAPGFGTEVTATNSSAAADADVPFFFEPTTIPLSFLHRTMRAFIDIGDIKGAMTTLMLLQRHTDNNKQKSVQQFFEMLQRIPQLRRDEPFTSSLPPVDFPAFDIKLPIPLLARLLDLITESKLFDVGRWLLFADDLDGPLIKPELRSHRNMAASVVRFGTLAGENELVLDIIKKVGTWNQTHQQQRMPAEVLIALLCCQLKLRRWESVRGMQRYVEETLTFRPRPVIFSTFAAELLRTAQDTKEAKEQAKEAFSGLLFAWEQLCMNNIRNELYCILSIMSTVDNEWKEYCSRFLAVSWRQAIELSTDDFNRMLGGVLDGYGSAKGRHIVEQWCYQTPNWFKAYRAPGGLPTMPQYRVGKAQQLENSPQNIELVQDSGTKLVLQGRIHPNRLTILAIVRRVQEEVTSWQQRGEDFSQVTRAEMRNTLRWAVRMLYWLGYDYEEIVRDLGSSLAELAEIEAPAAADDLELVEFDDQ
ncbi:hypothetical protein T440DRAFT_466896 [Plenodomus tracheiphilus IPT5]|uniref:Uncharacterized protein n=1 Tax=Plenodomus tracheiphilus IPT5 TaxID=1408161 RepID=A0A6A7BCV3_9PLEO|nr:hypothetical protein T440DRAFT_466896 [Plenodomus tracheiphilus IPT5]